MSVLWCGGEDIDFGNGNAATVGVGAGSFRSTFARCAIAVPTSGNTETSNQFPGGAVTSAWLACRYNSSGPGTNAYLFGAGLFGTNSGLFIGVDSTTATKLALKKYDGTTLTQLASESGTSLPLTLARLDMQIVSYGVSATVNIYVNSGLVITFTGDVTVSGMTNFNCVALGRSNGNNFISEVMVATDDLRAWPGLATMALTGAGTTNNWTNNTFSNINGTSFSDSNPTYTNVNATLQEYNITDLPAGTFNIGAVKIVARATESLGAAVSKVELGYNSGGSVAYGAGATKTMTLAYASYEQLDITNPVTSATWVQSDMNGLQLDIQALT